MAFSEHCHEGPWSTLTQPWNRAILPPALMLPVPTLPGVPSISVEFPRMGDLDSGAPGRPQVSSFLS